MRGRTKEDWIGGSFGLVAMLPAFISVMVGLLMLAIHCLAWLETAAWPKVTIRDVLNYFAGREVSLATGLLGLDKIIAALVALPVELGLIILAPIIWIVLWLWIYNVIFYRSVKK
jgi:hypothetical protein